MPNHYADMIEWFITHQKHPEAGDHQPAHAQ